MSKKKDKTQSSLRPEISRELDKIKLGKEKTEKVKKDSWVKEEKQLEQMQRARMKDVQRKILKDEDYDKVGEAFLWTLDQGLGDAFTSEVKEAWVVTYTTVADVMKAAAAEVSASLPTPAKTSWWNRLLGMKKAS